MGYASEGSIPRFKQEVTRLLQQDGLRAFTFWKGRVALYAILKAIGLRPGDEVIMPAYTCVVVPNAVMYLGGVPVYVDIDPVTCNMNVQKLAPKISAKTRAILAQNTYGLSSDLDPVREIAQPYAIPVIEDCAHGFGGTYKGKPNGTVADAAFYSTQWNKPFSTGLGGIAVTADRDIARGLQQMEEAFPRPSFYDRTFLRLLWFVREQILTPRTYWAVITLYRWLSRHNLVLGSSRGEELELPQEPVHFAQGLSSFQARIGLQQLETFCSVAEHRKQTAAAYNELLKHLGIAPPLVPAYAEHGFLRYPLLVKNRRALLDKAAAAHIELGDWFLSPLHPVQERLDAWNYRWGENPAAETISAHMVNLPTHPGIDEPYVARIRQFLMKNRDNIFTGVGECLEAGGR